MTSENLVPFDILKLLFLERPTEAGCNRLELLFESNFSDVSKIVVLQFA